MGHIRIHFNAAAAPYVKCQPFLLWFGQHLLSVGFWRYIKSNLLQQSWHMHTFPMVFCCCCCWGGHFQTKWRWRNIHKSKSFFPFTAHIHPIDFSDACWMSVSCWQIEQIDGALQIRFSRLFVLIISEIPSTIHPRSRFWIEKGTKPKQMFRTYGKSSFFMYRDFFFISKGIKYAWFFFCRIILTTTNIEAGKLKTK